MTFVIIVYGVEGGDLGIDCNTKYSDACDVVFRARAAVFAELTWLILISAWEFKSIRRSMFRLDPYTESGFPFFKDIYNNKFLFWSVVIGAVSVFPAVYIPGLNTTVFKHKGISWEWALSVGAVFIFVFGIEMWKLTKRKLHLFERGGEDGTAAERQSRFKALSLRQGFFTVTKARSIGRTFSGAKRRDTDKSLEGTAMSGITEVGSGTEVSGSKPPSTGPNNHINPNGDVTQGARVRPEDQV